MNNISQQFVVEIASGIAATAIVALCVALWHKASKLFRDMQHFLAVADTVPTLLPRVEALEADMTVVKADIAEFKGKPGVHAVA